MGDVVRTLIAVIAGGLLTYFVQARLDEKRAERERQRDAARREEERDRARASEGAEIRVSRRLVVDELDTLALHYALLATTKRFPLRRHDAQALLFPTEAWEAEKRVLARALPDNQWFMLATFMHSVPRIRAIAIDAEPEAPLQPEMIEQCRRGALLARELHQTLAGVPAPSVNERGDPHD